MKKGYTCKCGHQHRFTLWVFAHYDETLIHFCPDCGRENTFKKGKVIESRETNFRKLRHYSS
jgi:predicted  nucleic acid-binding Zn-ribbon protein